MDPIDAASWANEVNQSYCGDAYSRDLTEAAENTRLVAEAWSEVADSYEKHGDDAAPYLLFWRATLAQCLNRTEEAYDDFDGFIDRWEPTGNYADLVRQAKQRIRRLGRKKDLGDGPAAAYLMGRQILELGVGYSGGMQVLSEVCRGRSDLYLDGGCKEGMNTVWKSGEAGQPAGLDAQVAFYPALLGKGRIRFSPGLAGRFSLAIPTRALVAEEEGLGTQTAGPQWAVLVGPALRFQKSVGTGTRGVRLVVLPGFHARHGRISPMAGAINMGDVGLLDAGTYGWTMPGVALFGEMTVEMGRAVALRFGATGGIDFTQDLVELTEVEPFDDTYIIDVPPAGSFGEAGFAGGHFGLLVAFADGKMAFAPALRFRWSTTTLRYPNLPASEWATYFKERWTDDIPPELMDPEDNKVYSTRQDIYMIVVELGLRFGLTTK